MADLRVALAGYGYAGQTFHAPLIQSVSGLRLHRVVSSRADRVAADWPDVPVVAYDNALADPSVDLVVIATPNATHFEMARRAILAGKHLVVDKPMVVSDVEATALCTLAAQAKTVATVFHNRRWDADFLTMRALLGDGRLGRVVQLESRFDRCRPVVQDRWRERPGTGAGTWFDLGSHLVDQVMHLFGEPQAVFAELAAERPAAVVTDYFHVRLRYDGLRAVLEGSSLAVTPGPRFRVLGDEGSYTKFGLDPQEQMLRSGTRPRADARWGVDPRVGVMARRSDGEAADVANADGNYTAFYAGVRDAINGVAGPPVTLEDGARVVYALNLAEQSARERRELPWRRGA